MELISAEWLQQLTEYQHLYVGFSGGLDSTVLLHSLAAHPTLLPRIRAVHVHHGLSQNADNWQFHCRDFCRTLKIPFITRKVALDNHSNIEENARIARYESFSRLITEHDCLLQGHHRDDQAETLLLQLLRGAGIDGMAAMPPSKPFGKGVLFRPLLTYSRDTLELYACSFKLLWIDDESNTNSAFSRNYLRHHIMPLLRKKWPGVVGNLARSVSHCQNARSNLEALAHIDYPELAKVTHTLSIENLQMLNHTRLTNVLRTWLKRNKVRLPSTIIFNRLIDELILAPADSEPCVEWGSISLRRYRKTLYLMKRNTLLKKSTYEWINFPERLHLDTSYLYAIAAKEGLQVPDGCCIYVRFRQGGETFYWHGQTKLLKKLLQQWAVPTWERDTIPLIFINDVLAAVVGFAVSDDYYGQGIENTWVIQNMSSRNLEKFGERSNT